MPGPAPTPTRLKILTGNRGKRPLNEREPIPANKIPRKPPILRGKAATEWYKISNILFKLGILTDIDSTALAIYCQNWERWLNAEKALKIEGQVIKTKTGRKVVNPHISISNQASENMRKFLSEFGMTPASRTRVKVPIKVPPTANFNDI
jgi:P27 family predicted phage terminase small subunit